jgi:hypothetical protein
MKLAHIPTADLYAFLEQRQEGKAFRKVFFWGTEAERI